MLEVLSGIILKALTNSQLVQLGLIQSIDNTFTTDYLQNSAFVNVVNSYHGDITLIEANQNLYIILGRVNSSCLNGTFKYLAYNLSSLGMIERRSFDNVTRLGGDVIDNIEYSIFSSGDSSSSSSILGSSSTSGTCVSGNNSGNSCTKESDCGNNTSNVYWCQAGITDTSGSSSEFVPPQRNLPN